MNIIPIIKWHKKKFPDSDKWAVYRKLLEEIGELAEAMANENPNDAELEFGDVVICLVALSNKINFDIETSMNRSHYKNLMKDKK